MMRRAALVLPAISATLAFLALSPVQPAAQESQESSIVAAMRDELKRSMAELGLKDEPPPYYIAYELDDTASFRIIARLGALIEDSSSRDRTLRVEVRVGDYAFDSSRFITQGRGGGASGVVPISANGSASAPLDDDYDVMRRQIWLMTDAAYKRAVNVFARKKAAFQNRAESAALPDFSRETPAETMLPLLAPTAEAGRRPWTERARDLSALFESSPTIDSSDVWVAETRGTRYYVNSEGFKTVTPIQIASLRVAAEAQADDGMTVRDGFTLVEASLRDLPAPAELAARTRDVARRLAARRVAPIGDEFAGPVLVEGQASAEFIAQTLVPLMLARRPFDAENPRAAQAAQNQGPPLLGRIGLRVLSDSFAVSDTPSLTQFGGRPVPGAYVVDDEGVPAKDVTLVDKGRLVTLLTNRTPQKNLPRSNGHGRDTGAEAGVLQLRSTQAVPAALLKAKYLELLKVQGKPSGYIVRGIANPNDVPGGPQSGPVIVDAVRVTPDGAEEPVRGLRFAYVAPAAFRDLLDASEERTLYSYRASASEAISVIVPSLIFEELEIERTREILQKPPVTPSPLRN